MRPTALLFTNVMLNVQEQEKLLAQRKVPGLQSQLEEFKSALCQLQAQKQRLQTEVGQTGRNKTDQEKHDPFYLFSFAHKLENIDIFFNIFFR